MRRILQLFPQLLHLEILKCDSVIALAKASANFEILLGSRSAEKGQKALEALQAEHSDLLGTVKLLQLDVTSHTSVMAAKEHIETTYGKLDVLINNAAVLFVDETRLGMTIRQTYETNTFAPALVTHVFVPLLQKSSAPRVIHGSSDQGSITERLGTSHPYHNLRGNSYRMSKAALNMLAVCHKVDFEDWGCKVCAFNPGFMITSLTGEEGKKMRIKAGAREASVAAKALADVVLGKREEDVAKVGIVDVDGGVKPWWAGSR